MDLTRLSYWFPKLEQAGVPVPRTTIINADEKELRSIYESFEQKNVVAETLIDRIKVAADGYDYPCFLRTDHFSGKHNWNNACCIQSPQDIPKHVVEIAYFWECVNMLAPPVDVWVVREFLPTIPYGVCEKYGNMPICKEFRFFVNDGEIKCFHPYWPIKALEEGGAKYSGAFDYDAFCTPDNECELRELASAAGKAVGGEWSVDLLETRSGWYITDMAEAHKSYHWEGCLEV
jgi:hypothetical protein